MLASIKIVIDCYPNARNVVFRGQDPFSYCAYHSLCDLLKVLDPSAIELANKDLYCTAIDTAFSVLDTADNRSLDTLQYLLQVLGNTISNEFWSVKIKEIFKNKYYSAREETPNQRRRYIQTMQLMLDWTIISLSQEFIAELTEAISPEMKAMLDRGIWVRGIEDLTGEVAILNKRETLTDEELNSMRHSQKEQSKTNYTKYSPANFVCSYAQYHFYDPSCAGVILDIDDGPFSYWQDGSGREMLSAEMDFTQERLFNQDGYSGQFSEIDKSKILDHIQLLQIEYLQTHDQSLVANQVIDHHAGATLPVPIIFQPPQWNEGLLRYKKKHIIGFYVYPDKKESVINAVVLKQALQLSALPVFALSEKTGALPELAY